MATKQEILDEFANQSTSIANIAADIADLLAKIGAGGLTAAEAEELLNEAHVRSQALAELAGQHEPNPPTP